MGSRSSPAGPGLGDDDGSLTVSELAGMIRERLEESFGSPVWVRGQVADLSRSSAGHVFLDLVEPAGEGTGSPAAVLHSVIWESRKSAINHALQKANWGRVSDGDRIKVRVRVGFYPRQGRVTLGIDEVDPSYTLGRWKAERERVAALLRTEGVFDDNRRLEMPVAPYRIGLITSAGTNAYADFTSTLAESGLGWEVLFHHSRVQGDAARRTLVSALEGMAGLAPDVICLVRGGGSTTDLAVFDHEQVARAVAGAPAPVITGIGHELDRTVSDLVAHRTERTPTACASWLVERVRTYGARIDRAGREIAEAAGALVRGHRRRLAGSPVEVSAAVEGALDRCRRRLGGAARMLPAVVRPCMESAGAVIAARRAALARDSSRALGRERTRLEAWEREADAYDPQRNLARGWSITRRPGGGVIRSVSQVGAPEVIETWLSDGTVISAVAETRPGRAAQTEEVKERP